MQGDLTQMLGPVLNFVVRPSRVDNYTDFELVFKSETINGKPCLREDIDIKNPKDLKMKSSFYYINDSIPRPTVIYLHGNGSFRGEGASHAKQLLSNGFNLLVFDYIGCGKSDGTFITLGANEQYDIQPLIDYLKGTKRVTKIFLYGRSMGAATALLYVSGKPDPIVAGVIADSPFAYFSELFKDIASSLGIPEGFEQIIYPSAVSAIQEKYGFDLKELNPIKGVEKVKLPALFIHALNDGLVLAKHSKMISDVYGGEKELLNFASSSPDAHNSYRPKEVQSKVLSFLTKHSK